MLSAIMVEHPQHRLRRPQHFHRSLPGGAADDLRFIRQTMERSVAFTAVSGWGLIVLGLTALAAAYLAARQANAFAWLRVWLAEAILAVTIALLFMAWKASRRGLPLFTGMRPSGPNKWSGQIYNADDGGTYASSVSMAGSDSLRVEGCVGALCGGETWTRFGH